MSGKIYELEVEGGEFLPFLFVQKGESFFASGYLWWVRSQADLYAGE